MNIAAHFPHRALLVACALWSLLMLGWTSHPAAADQEPGAIGSALVAQVPELAGPADPPQAHDADIPTADPAPSSTTIQVPPGAVATTTAEVPPPPPAPLPPPTGADRSNSATGTGTPATP